jgi:hypothetical protein
MSELGDVLELLHGAAGRVRTLTATLLDWHDEERALRAVEAARHHGAAIAVLQHKGALPRQYEQRTLVQYRPGALGISDGAITWQSTLMLCSSRASSKPVGPAS